MTTKKTEGPVFDQWPEKYDRWFETPLGSLIKKYEAELLMELLNPGKGEKILDAGCGTGVFTRDVLEAGARVIGLDLSQPMLMGALRKLRGKAFRGTLGDMRYLPFSDRVFDKTVSVTAIEFMEDAERAVGEMFRVTKPGGCIVLATLNRLSPWANRRDAARKRGHPLFRHAVFRTPEEIRSLAPVSGVIKTAIHFRKDDAPDVAAKMEQEGRRMGRDTGAFLAVHWEKRRNPSSLC